MNERKIRLQKAKDKRAKLSIGQPFLDSFESLLEKKISELKSVLGLGTELTNLDELVDQLSQVESLKPEISSLRKSIENIKLPNVPNSIGIKGLGDIVRAIGRIKVETSGSFDEKQFNEVITKLEALNKAAQTKVTIDNRQADEFIPFRRVIQVGNRFFFDDSVPSGGGGGGGGTSSASSGGGLTDTELRASAVPVSGTFFQATQPISHAALTELAAAINASSQLDVNIAAGNITGFATSVKQDTIIGHLDGVEASLASIVANQLPDSHNVTVDNASLAVTGTFWQATQPISGTVTANAGTNLNTSALALEAGGNLASVKTNTDKIPSLGQALAASSVPVVLTAAQITTLTPPAAITGFATSAKQDTAQTSLDTIASDTTAIETAVQIMDDWDESDRAKVNPIAGQAGVQGASGTVTALTQRVVLATDVALPAGTNAIGKITQPATPTLANVTMTGSSVTLQASNTARRNLMIFNDSGVVVYVKLGTTASSTSFTVKMVDQSYYELPDPVYTGIVTALGASGDVRVTEVV